MSLLAGWVPVMPGERRTEEGRELQVGGDKIARNSRSGWLDFT
jgi:hypothetical protein